MLRICPNFLLNGGNMKIRILFTAAILSTATIGLTACNPNMSANNYNYANTGYAQQTIPGTIVSMRPVQVRNNTGVGTGVGVAGGAIAGSMIGGGWRSNLAGALGGAVVGGLVGNAAENRFGTQTAIEYIVKGTNGRSWTIVQGAQTSLAVGQRVWVIMGNPPRIIPRN